MKNGLLPILIFVSMSVSESGCTRQESREEAPAPVASADSVRLTPEAASRFGLSFVTVESRPDNETISTTGDIKADENRVFHINSLTSGRVISDKVMLGDVIKAGQTLAIIQNLDVAKVYGDYIHQAHENEIQIHLSQTRLALAKKNYERIKNLYQEKIAAEKDLIKAESDKSLEEEILRGHEEHSTHIKEEASAMLSAYGVKLGNSQSEHVQSESPITTPRAGVIIKKTITVGDVVSNTEPLYVVGDLSHVWLDIAVYDKQLQSIKEGDNITFSSDSLPGRAFTSHISYIKPSTEDASGTFVARAILDNKHLELKPGMLGQVKIESHDARRLAFVPEDALQKYGAEQFVFVVDADGSFKKQVVLPVKKINDGYLIDHGVAVGQQIIGKGSFTLKAELLKGTLAGKN